MYFNLIEKDKGLNRLKLKELVILKKVDINKIIQSKSNYQSTISNLKNEVSSGKGQLSKLQYKFKQSEKTKSKLEIQIAQLKKQINQ